MADNATTEDDNGEEGRCSPSGARKRPKNESNWKKNVAKQKINVGDEYVSILDA